MRHFWVIFQQHILGDRCLCSLGFLLHFITQLLQVLSCRSIDEERETFDAVCLMFLCIRMGSLRRSKGASFKHEPSSSLLLKLRQRVPLYKMHSSQPCLYYYLVVLALKQHPKLALHILEKKKRYPCHVI